MNILKTAVLVWAALCSILTTAAVGDENGRSNEWLQWRGPTRDGYVQRASWPESLDDDRLTSLWRVEAGPSYSGPIVSEDRVTTRSI